MDRVERVRGERLRWSMCIRICNPLRRISKSRVNVHGGVLGRSPWLAGENNKKSEVDSHRHAAQRRRL